MDDKCKSQFNLLGIFTLKCNVKEPSFCLQCESCRLIDKINSTKSWFRSLGYNNQKLFLEELIQSAPDLMNKLPAILYGLHSKDYQYAKSRLEPSVDHDGFQSNTNHSLDINKIKDNMTDCLSWFRSASEWTHSNYILVLLQLCSTQLLDTVKDFVAINNDISITYNVHEQQPESSEFNKPDYQFQNIDLSINSKCNSAPAIGSDHFKNRINSARERVVFDDKIKCIDVEKSNIHEGKISHANSRVSSRSPFRLSQNSSRAQFCTQSNSSARCTPLSHIDLSDDMMIKSCIVSVDTPTSDSYFNEAKDLIKCLPVHLAKKIFGYLDQISLKKVSCVNKLWNELGKQVKAEVKYIQARKEDVMMMQSTGAKIPHPGYARHVPVFIPKLNVEGKVQRNTEGKHIDVEIITDEFADIDMESCYENQETEKIIMDERNVYCSSYNVLMLESRHDPNRRIHYNGGDLISIGSSDRKIHLINVNTGDRVKRIYGHSGSVKCVYIDEKNNIAISGSYDTTIRSWNLKNGKCEVIFIGHQGTVVCVTVSKQLLVSAAVDCYIKIWNLSTGKCNFTLAHSNVIRVLDIVGDQIITGSTSGDVISWDMNTHIVSKEIKAHQDAVACLKCNLYFIFSGSSDGVVKLWNNIGNLSSCLKTYKHPGEVSCLDILFCRLITGCFDGKIRVWNILNGNCLRVIRGNSKNDPISYLFACSDRLVVNTVSSILVYNFESVKWNRSAPREQGEINKSKINSRSEEIRPYSYIRAQKLIYHGSPLHNAALKNEEKIPIVDKKLATCKEDDICRNRINRIRSAPTVSKVPVNNGTNANRVKSASRNFSSVDLHISRIKSATQINRAAISAKANIIDKHISHTAVNRGAYDKHSKGAVRTRCRSAPVQRVITVPPNERGASTSSFTFNENASNKITLKTPDIREVKRPKTAIPAGSACLKDLKLRTFHSQLSFEQILRHTKIK